MSAISCYDQRIYIVYAGAGVGAGTNRLEFGAGVSLLYEDRQQDKCAPWSARCCWICNLTPAPIPPPKLLPKDGVTFNLSSQTCCFQINSWVFQICAKCDLKKLANKYIYNYFF